MRSIEKPFIPSKQETRADITDRAFREIVEAERKARRLKNEKLRSARLAQEQAGRLDDAASTKNA